MMEPRARQRVGEDELNRRSDSVVRAIGENPGQSAAMLGRMLGDVTAREVRERIRRARERGARITIGPAGQGYYLVEQIADEKDRAEMVRRHYERSRSYLVGHAGLMRQVGHWTATEIAQGVLFDVLIDRDQGGLPLEGPLTMDHIGSLPPERRSGLTRLLVSLLDSLAKDPSAWAIERAMLADRFGKVFMSARDAEMVRQAKRLLAEIDL